MAVVCETSPVMCCGVCKDLTLGFYLLPAALLITHIQSHAHNKNTHMAGHANCPKFNCSVILGWSTFDDVVRNSATVYVTMYNVSECHIIHLPHCANQSYLYIMIDPLN